jgi:RNA polymerase sigma-70 factor (sigma-E family)
MRGEGESVSETRDDEFAQYASMRWMALVRGAVLLGCAPSDAEDIAQTALLRCYRAWDKVAQARDRDAYVYTVLVNCRRDALRRHWTRETPTADVSDRTEPDRTGEVELVDAVDRALAQLGDDARTALVLRYYAHLTDEQVADALGIPLGTVKSRISRALDRLSTDPTLTDALRGIS